jgi:threonyl-tRNA synthetase
VKIVPLAVLTRYELLCIMIIILIAGGRVSYPTKLQSQRETQTLLGIPDTCAQVLAIVLQNLFRETKVTIRSTTERGFYIEYPINHP